MTIDVGLYCPNDEVRLIIGDTSKELITDQTIDALLLVSDNNVQQAAVKALQYLIADCAHKVDQEVGDVKVWYSQKYDQLNSLLNKLLKDPSFMLAPALHRFGGVSKSKAKAARTSDARFIKIKEGDSLASRFNFDPDSPFFLDEE